jgi:hypothetical protein
VFVLVLGLVGISRINEQIDSIPRLVTQQMIFTPSDGVMFCSNFRELKIGKYAWTTESYNCSTYGRRVDLLSWQQLKYIDTDKKITVLVALRPASIRACDHEAASDGHCCNAIGDRHRESDCERALHLVDGEIYWRLVWCLVLNCSSM